MFPSASTITDNRPDSRAGKPTTPFYVTLPEPTEVPSSPVRVVVLGLPLPPRLNKGRIAPFSATTPKKLCTLGIVEGAQTFFAHPLVAVPLPGEAVTRLRTDTSIGHRTLSTHVPIMAQTRLCDTLLPTITTRKTSLPQETGRTVVAPLPLTEAW